MKRPALSLSILLFFSLSVFSQNNSTTIKTVEFVSPLGGQAKSAPVHRSCFSFIAESAVCGPVVDLYYGNLRSGSDQDWFQAVGEGSRNRIISLGKKEWTDDFSIPEVEPYAELKAGNRQKSAQAAEVTYREPARVIPDRVVPDQVSRFEEGDKTGNFPEVRDGSVRRRSDYKPFKKAVLGHMYVMRVVDEKNDFYVLFRVDELEQGRRAKISWKKIAAPETK